MADPRPILYGVSDYSEIRKANAWFVDRTAKIRDLEKVRYAIFLRPRRFGKSLLCAILEAYYDVRYTDRFEELFSGTDIGANPTGERGKYLILRFDFSAVSKDVSNVQEDFDYKASLQCDTFANKYREELGEKLVGEILSAPDCGKKLAHIIAGLKGTKSKLYVIIDEYDNFTNTILAESGLDAYGRLCHGEGFFKQFFAELKAATSGIDAALPRLFITGVSPVTMDDVTSGFNIGTNISLDPVFADLTGFRHDDLGAIAKYYGNACGFDAAKAEVVCLEWFDNYRFGAFDAPPMANTTLVLNFFDKIVRAGTWPDNYIDANLRTDYAKIRHLVTLGHRLDASERRLNGNFGILEKLVSGGSLSEPLIDSFQAKFLSNKENFTSLLYWLGITTIIGKRHGRPVFGLPNETLKKLAADMIPAAYFDVHKIDERVFAINDALYDFAFEGGDWRGFVGILCEIVRENFRVRDSIDGEKTVQSTIVALLVAAAGPYFINHEGESGGGFYDIALKPRLLDWPDIAHAALIELKYLKPGDPAPTPDALAAIKAEATRQLDQYSADSALAAEWRRPSVALHRLVLVFKGGDCLLAEEV
ncbi:MAG: AAA family ATPase [Kiritimatiellae bacterium]|nr:AAA family ATPase [Kiritimatiellia bacterium]